MFGRNLKGKPARASKLAKRARQFVNGGLAYAFEGERITGVLAVVPGISPNPNNGSHGHWSAVAKLRESQRLATMHVLARTDMDIVMRALGGQIRRVHFVRLGPGLLDDDAVPPAVKAYRDQLCAWIAGDNTPTGRGDDGPKCGIKFTYDQQRQRQYGVRIEISR